MMTFAGTIGALGLVLAVYAFAQRIGSWQSKVWGKFLAVLATGLLLAWCFLVLPAPVAWGVSAVAWSIGLWFIFPLIRGWIDARRKPPVITDLPITDASPDPAVSLDVAAAQLERGGPGDLWTFKSKLRISLTSEFTEGIDVLAPDWEAGKGDVRTQIPQGFCSLQLEGPQGWKAKDWLNEVGRLHVEPGQTFRLWIGLDQSFSDSDMKRRHEEQRLGTLVLPVVIGGKYVEFRKRF